MANRRFDWSMGHPVVVALLVVAAGVGVALVRRALRDGEAPRAVPAIADAALPAPKPAASAGPTSPASSAPTTAVRPTPRPPSPAPRPLPPPTESAAPEPAGPARTEAPPLPSAPVPAASRPDRTVSAPGPPAAARAPSAVDPARRDAAIDAPEPADERDPESDRTPPSLEAVRFDPPEVQDGGSSTLFVQASDDLSGPKLAWGLVRSPSGSASLPFGPQAPGGADPTAFKITIPRDAESGLWYVAQLSLADKAGNTVGHAFAPANVPPGATLRVVSTGSDSTPPEVLRAWMDAPVANGGESTTIHFETRDDRSGVASVSGFFQSPSKAAQIWFSGISKSDATLWDAEVRVPAKAECGDWTLQHLRLVDKAGNVAQTPGPSRLLEGGGFRVSGESDCDSSPPTIESFSLSPTIVSNESVAEIVVTAVVADVGSGAIALSGWFEGPVASSGQSPRNNFACAPNPEDPSAPWVGKIVVPQFAAKGLWRVGGISVQDRARNFRHYAASDPVLAGVAFEVH